MNRRGHLLSRLASFFFLTLRPRFASPLWCLCVSLCVGRRGCMQHRQGNWAEFRRSPPKLTQTTTHSIHTQALPLCLLLAL